VPPSANTVRDYLEIWLGAIGATVRPTTLMSYELQVRRVLPYLGSTRLQKVTGSLLNSTYARLLQDGRMDGAGGLSPASVRRVHAMLHRALRDAVRWNHLSRNPADTADPPRVEATTRRQLNTWTADQLREFLQHVRQDRLYAAYVLAATTGMRCGEMLGVRWSDVDLQLEQLSVDQTLVTVGHQVQVSATKTARGRRSVDLDSATVAILRDHAGRQANEIEAAGELWRQSDLVFTDPIGRPVHPNTFTKHFAQRVAETALPRIRLHDLRHTHATLALKAGQHPKVVSERLGHATVAFTLDVYSHVVPGMQKQLAEQLGAMILGGSVEVR
jgi:integrase